MFGNDIIFFVCLFGSWVTKQILCVSFCWLSRQSDGSFIGSGGGGTEHGRRGCKRRGRGHKNSNKKQIRKKYK